MYFVPWPPPPEHPLFSAHLKHERAVELLSEVHREIRTYVSSQPDHFVADVDPASGDHRAYRVIDDQPNAHIALVVGDCINNMRAALDHAVFGLSVHYADHDLSPDEEQQISYPVCSTVECWRRATSAALRFLPPDVQRAIDAHQPYHDPAGPARANNPLRVLHDLWNADKHRRLHLVGAALAMHGVGVPEDATGRHRFTAPLTPGGSVVSRLPADLQPIEESDFYSRVEVQLEPTRAMPTIAQGRKVEAVLESLIRDVGWRLSNLATQPGPLSG